MGTSNLGRKFQDEGTEKEPSVACYIPVREPEENAQRRPASWLTWITTVLEKGPDPTGARLQKGRKVGSPLPQTHRQPGQRRKPESRGPSRQTRQIRKWGWGRGRELSRASDTSKEGRSTRGPPTVYGSITNQVHLIQPLTAALTYHAPRNHKRGGNYPAHNAPRRRSRGGLAELEAGLPTGLVARKRRLWIFYWQEGAQAAAEGAYYIQGDFRVSRYPPWTMKRNCEIRKLVPRTGRAKGLPGSRGAQVPKGQDEIKARAPFCAFKIRRGEAGKLP